MDLTAGLVSVLIVRKMPSGNFIVGSYLLDIFCLGLKNTDFRFNIDALDCEIYINMHAIALKNLKPARYVEAHNYIFGAVEYAESLGFKPDKDFALTQYILEEDNDAIELIEYEFGRNGRPLYIPGVNDDKNKIAATLKRTVGVGNYDVMLLDGDYGDDFEDEDDFDDEDFDFDEEDEYFDDEDFDEENNGTEDTDFEVVDDK